MENTYYREMIAAQNEAGRLKKELEKLNTTITGMDVEIRMLRLEVQAKVHEIMELTLTDEEDCPCGNDCGCKGDDCDSNEDLLP